jgi:hypothetical protein
MEISNIIIDCINNKKPVSFSKYGDGEYFCANFNDGNKYGGHNCDKDNYTDKKKTELINSFKYMVDETPNAYIGFWNDGNQCKFWNSLVSKDVNWAKYHTFIMDDDSINEKIDLYKTIKFSPIKKIYICNPLLIKAKKLLNIDHMVHVPFNNWFDNLFDEVINNLKNIINPHEQYIIMTSAGMGAKCLISELTKLFPNNIYLDIGSALDTICTKRATRDRYRSYEKIMHHLRDIIPDDWNSNEYDYIYNEARVKLGLHM